MTNKLSVQTEFKIYQVDKMERKIEGHTDMVAQKDLSDFLKDKNTLLNSLEVNGPNAIINNANQRLRSSLVSEILKIEKLMKDKVVEHGGDKKFYKDAISATVESLVSDKIFPKTRMVHLSVLNSDLIRNLETFEAYNKDLREVVISFVNDFAEKNNVPSDMFMVSTIHELNGERLINLSFPGCSMINEVAFSLIKEIDKEFHGLMAVEDGKGVNLLTVASNNDTYQRALTSEGKSVSDGLYAERPAYLSDSYDDIVTNDTRYEKVYDKWEKTSFENKECFDFGMVK
jgi:hypothetical protein